jgi:hypothetical protein
MRLYRRTVAIDQAQAMLNAISMLQHLHNDGSISCLYAPSLNRAGRTDRQRRKIEMS